MRIKNGKWRIVKLGDIFKISSGGTPSKSKPEYYENGTIQWVRTGDLKDKYITRVEGLITEEALNNSSAKLFPVDTVLIAMYGATIGACSILSVKAATNQACAAFLPNNEVDSSYLYYFLCSKKNDFIRMGVGGAQPNISATILKGVKIPLPPLETQNQIAKTLDTAAELLVMRKQQLTELDNLIKSTFYDMFGDPVANEKGWEIKQLKDLCENLDSQRIPITSTDREKGIYPYYGASGIVDYVKDYIFDGTYLLISEDGANLLARVSPIAFSIFGKNWVNNHAHVLKFNDYPLQLFVEYVINNMDISNYVTGSAQPKLNQAKLNSISVPYPSLNLQTKFAEIVTKIEEQKSLVKKAIDETQYLFDSLMSEYFE